MTVISRSVTVRLVTIPFPRLLHLMDSSSHSSSSEGDVDSESDDSDPPIITHPEESYETWSDPATLVVNRFAVAHALDLHFMQVDTLPPNRYIRDYSTYPSKYYPFRDT